jgi:NHL repeat-containing protein
LLVLVAVPLASASLGVGGWFGNPTAAGGSLGGEFGGLSASPRGVAVREATGDVYVVDTSNHRVQRFSSDGAFELAVGFDVIQAGKPGDLGTGFEVCTVAADCKAGINTVTVPGAPGGELSGPQGVAVNQVTGDFYVTDGFARVQQFDADGGFVRAWGKDVVRLGQPGDNPAVSAAQSLTVDASAGTFKLTFKGQSTSDLAATATAAEVDAALELLPTVGANNVAVTGGPGGAGGATPYSIAFTGTLANNPVPTITASNGATPLTGGAASATVAVTVAGSAGVEVCNSAASCKQGTGVVFVGGAFAPNIGYPAVMPAGAPNEGNVVVGDGGQSRVQEFTASGQFVRAFGYDVVSSGVGNTGTGYEICKGSDLDVCKAGVTGSGVGQFASTTTGTPNLRVAGDVSGAIYVAETRVINGNGNGRVQKFTPSGANLVPSAYCPSIGGAVSLCDSTTTQNSPTEIAVDPSTGHVHVVKSFEAGAGTPPANTPERRVLEFDSGGALVDTHLANYGINSVNGLAVKNGAERMYVTTTTPEAGVHILAEPVEPTVTTSATTAITATTATLNGTVNPNGGDPFQQTSYRFEYSLDGTDWVKAPATDADAGGGTNDVTVSEDIAGLQPNRGYQVRLIATKGGRPTVSSGDAGDFTTAAAVPGAETREAFWDGTTGSLVLNGSVNPNNQETSYYFEYGPDTDYGNRVPVSDGTDAGSGGQFVPARQTIDGLDTDVVYHYRVVAENATGTTVGDDRTAPGYAEPEARGYEWVSKGDSWGSGISEITGAVADDGETVQFIAVAIDQPPSLPGPLNGYIARRGPTGWTVDAPFPVPELANGSSGGTEFMAASDLTATLWPTATRTGRERGEVRWAIVDNDGNQEWASDQISPLSQMGLPDISDAYLPLGASADLSTFVFDFASLQKINGTRGVKLFPDEPLLGSGSGLYQVSRDGGAGPVLSLVNRATDPAPGVDGVVIGGYCGAGLGGSLTNEVGGARARAVSEDGSVVYFSAAVPGSTTPTECGTAPRRLFKRVDSTTTVEVSQPQCSGSCSGSGGDVFQSASVDGSVAFFTSPRQLTDSDDDSTSDLYVYDASPPSGQPTLVQASAGDAVSGHVVGSGASVRKVLDVSADGSRVYFTATGVLAGANAAGVAPSAGEDNVYVFERDDAHPGGRIGFIASVAANDSLVGLETPAYALPHQGADADGRYLLFGATTGLVVDDVDTAQDIYRYDDESGGLVCVSCVGNENIDAVIKKRGVSTSAPMAPQEVRAATADVSTVVFKTVEALSAADTNSAPDVYAWHDGTVTLISGGTGEIGVSTPEFSTASISPDGKSVFFQTAAALDPTDGNNQADQYVARVGGGFPVAPTPPAGCAVLDDLCQGGGTLPLISVPLTLGRLPGVDNAVSGLRPSLRVAALTRAQRTRLAAGRAVSLRARVNRPGRVRVVGKSVISGRRVTVLSATKLVSKPGVGRLAVRLSHGARRALGRARGLTVSLSVRLSGMGRPVTSTLRLSGRRAAGASGRGGSAR